MTGERSVAAKLVGFAAALLVVFVAAYGVGVATEPTDAPGSPPAPGVTTSTTMPAGMDMEHGS